MSKRTIQQLCSYGMLLVLENALLGQLSAFFPELVYYVIKTTILGLTFYIVGHRRLNLRIPMKPKGSFFEQLRVNGVNLFFLIFSSLPLLVYGLRENPSTIPSALVIGLGAGLLEEYICRGILLKIAFRDGIQSHRQVLQAVLLSSFFFGLAHMSNLISQPLDVTLFQVYYAAAMGIYDAAVVIRTRSLVWVILTHFMMDFSGILATANTNSSAQPTLVMIILWLIVAIIAFILLRPKVVKKLIDLE